MAEDNIQLRMYVIQDEIESNPNIGNPLGDNKDYIIELLSKRNLNDLTNTEKEDLKLALLILKERHIPFIHEDIILLIDDIQRSAHGGRRRTRRHRKARKNKRNSKSHKRRTN